MNSHGAVALALLIYVKSSLCYRYQTCCNLLHLRIISKMSSVIYCRNVQMDYTVSFRLKCMYTYTLDYSCNLYSLQLSYDSEHAGAVYPAVDYDSHSDKGPESGYQTPEQRSEFDYPQQQKGSWSRSQLNQHVPAGAGPGGVTGGGTVQRQSQASQGSMPQYPAPNYPAGYNTQGYGTQGYDRSHSHEENVYDTRIPPKMHQSHSHQAFSNTMTPAPPMSPHMSHSTSATMSPQMSVRGQDSSYQGGGMENIYDRTLPAAGSKQHVPTPVRNGDQGIQAIRRDSIYASQPQHQQVPAGVPPPPPCGSVPAPPRGGLPSPPLMGNQNFPPPPPQFSTGHSTMPAPPDSPPRTPLGPRTMPKPSKKATGRPGPLSPPDNSDKDHSLPFPVRLKQVDSPIKKENLEGQGINKGQVSGGQHQPQPPGPNEPLTPPLQKVVPPPAPPLSTLPKNPAHGTAPLPPPLDTMPRHPPGTNPVPPPPPTTSTMPPPRGQFSPPVSPPPPPPPHMGMVPPPNPGMPPPPPAFFGDDQLPPPPPPFPGGGAQSLQSQIRNISLQSSDGYEQCDSGKINSYCICC